MPTSLTVAPLIAFVCLVVVKACLLAVRQGRKALSKDPTISRYPPIITLDLQEQFHNPRKAYASLFDKYGPVIGTFRNGKVEYVVDKLHAVSVLTRRNGFLSMTGLLEEVNAQGYLGSDDSSLITVVRKIAHSLIEERRNDVTQQHYAVTSESAEHIFESIKADGIEWEDEECIEYCQEAVLAGLLTSIMGKNAYTKHDVAAAIQLSEAFSRLIAVHSRSDWFGRWVLFPFRCYILTPIIMISGGLPFFFRTVPKLWLMVSRLDAREWCTTGKGYEDIIIKHLMRREFDNTSSDRLSLSQRALVIFRVMGLISAASHTVVVACVWTIYRLASHPEFVNAIREEALDLACAMDSVTDSDLASLLDNCNYMDSFIRETMRLRSDIWSTVRTASEDTPVGDYIIPKGGAVRPIAFRFHEDTAYHGDNASAFDGFRWVMSGKRADAPGPSYGVFGLGTLSCPGRYHAIRVVKLVALTLLARVNVTTASPYVVPDPHYPGVIPPKGRLRLTRLGVSEKVTISPNCF